MPTSTEPEPNDPDRLSPSDAFAGRQASIHDPAWIEAETGAPGETEALAAELARRLRPGDVVLVSGELGAGKTTFVRGACRALGVRAPVTSPTFTLARRYDGDVPISHLDLYRLGDLSDEDPALLADELAEDRVAFVEWPEVGAPAGLEPRRVAARVSLAHRGGDRRLVRIEP
ncbi:MAG: tRNA (adenosine(37)-N6)-threonylcarbamoyltransferase complex ATPase subunit type 1 TsaE [Actinobacteria bacterium]|nr:tRNA (adenosine(37)-N6)-threonylcarbamoyltransferase complex ATPase subunit type 1 TsaE [Actinomycetota bacterium]